MCVCLNAKQDAVNGVGWYFSVFVLTTDAEHDVSVKRDGGGSTQRFTHPALSSTFIHLHHHLNTKDNKYVNFSYSISRFNSKTFILRDHTYQTGVSVVQVSCKGMTLIT